MTGTEPTANPPNRPKMNPKLLLQTIFSFIFLAPVITIIFTLLYLYRRVVDVVLRIQLRDKYVGLLDGSDCVWAVEDATARSVINILVVLEKDARHSNVSFLESFRELVKSRMLDSPFEKLLYHRRKKFGYHFWEKGESVDLEGRVRWLEGERRICDGSCDNVYNGHLKNILRSVCNEPLPEDHSTSWEILIGRSCSKSGHHYLRRMEERAKNGKIRIPVLFRVHHSLGDGSALLKFFLEAVIDKDSTGRGLQLRDTNIRISGEDDLQTKLTVPPPNYSEACLLGQQNLACPIQNEVLSATMPFIHSMIYLHMLHLVQNYLEAGLKHFKCLTLEDVRDEVKMFVSKKINEFKDFVVKEVYERIRAFVDIMSVAVIAPICLAHQAIRSLDGSVLHGADLSGEKVVSYWLEDDFKNSYDQTLLTKIQNIKYLTGARFVDVFLAALSVSLHKHFLRVDENAPKSLSVVLPAKIQETSESVSLNNSFSVGVLPLCISQINGEASLNPNEDSRVFDRLQDIKRAHDDLKNSPDYMVNFLVIKYLSAALPEKILRPFLESHCTMVFSNLAGPQEVRILGSSLKNVAFWIPNRSSTGIGCSLLTYRGYVHLSLMADKALIPDEKLLTEILENSVREIDDLYNTLTVSSFSKSFDGNITTPTKGEIGVL